MENARIGRVNRRQAILTGLGLTAFAPTPAYAQISTQLSRQTDLAFDAYITNVEAKLDWRSHLQTAPDGKVAFAAGNGQSPVDVTGGLIHDWMAAAIAPGVTVDKVLTLLQDYASYKTHYAPNVSDSRLLSKDGDIWRVYLKLYKSQILTVILNTEYAIQYKPLSDGRWAVISRSTKVAEVDNGKELPIGTGFGFLWRLNSYWLLEPRREGVYLECRAISLSRDVPVGLGWIIKPMITTVPKESLMETIGSTIKALR